MGPNSDPPNQLPFGKHDPKSAETIDFSGFLQAFLANSAI
jgi:hypothetical protein